MSEQLPQPDKPTRNTILTEFFAKIGTLLGFKRDSFSKPLSHDLTFLTDSLVLFYSGLRGPYTQSVQLSKKLGWKEDSTRNFFIGINTFIRDVGKFAKMTSYIPKDDKNPDWYVTNFLSLQNIFIKIDISGHAASFILEIEHPENSGEVIESFTFVIPPHEITSTSEALDHFFPWVKNTGILPKSYPMPDGSTLFIVKDQTGTEIAYTKVGNIFYNGKFYPIYGQTNMRPSGHPAPQPQRNLLSRIPVPKPMPI
jgi:hypothetical protein